VHIGEPQRVFEVEPLAVPIPEILPEPERVPESVPAEPAEPAR
jgi:hypothetical protein